ncbi:MAG: HIT family hydrolase [Chloroflexi bacterium]|nr:HIT domain-containing protein [Anaerolineae bacterium]RLC72531.1 MAG: HIT family hydrolase [Chloroflexota bacterium]
MKRLWAPWRMRYLTGEKEKGCIFCTRIAESRDRENYILYRGERGFLILNLYPYNNGHMMAVPYNHVASLEDLDTETLTELMLLVNKGLAALREAMSPQGFNVGVNIGEVAGAGVAGHVHIHVVPRWGGDTNFMPILADTRVVPELLDQTYERLRAVMG